MDGWILVNDCGDCYCYCGEDAAVGSWRDYVPMWELVDWALSWCVSRAHEEGVPEGVGLRSIAGTWQ